ncbi:MAG: MarR family transcriptional regulator [Solirubrobacterales bacterium]
MGPVTAKEQQQTRAVPEASPSGVPEARMEAWRALLVAHTSLTAGVERALAEEDLPPLTWYDVLSSLERAPEKAARPRDLGCGVSISRSGLTRLLDRMEEAGLIERASCPTDRRGTWVVLTAAGAEILARMRPVYERELAEGFSAEITDEEAETLSRLLGRVSGSG